MPVTVWPQPHKVGANADRTVTTASELLAITSRAWTLDSTKPRDPYLESNKRSGPEDRLVLRSSFENLETQLKATRSTLVPYGNGFVEGIIRAFQQDLHLVLRPDDVWLAILIQFSFYVNGRADDVRQLFVNHEGKKTLEIDMTPDSLDNVDFGVFSSKVVEAMKGHLSEPDLAEWLLPQFSTTTPNDRAVSALVLMATMKAYYEYVMLIGCGFPSVTLEGEKEDWENLAERTRHFAKYGDEPAEWSVYLGKVLEKMVASFDKPNNEEIKQFWMKACHTAGADGSLGVATMSGWLPTFCFWNEEGERIRQFSDERLAQVPHQAYIDRQRLVLDDVSFPIIWHKNVTKGVSDVPVLVKDIASGQTRETTIVAGLVAMQGSCTKDKGTVSGIINQVQPKSGWWMLLDKMIDS